MLRRVRATRFVRELEAFVQREAVPGRVNLLAPDRGVFRFDLDALDRFAPRLNIIRISSTRQLPSMRLGEHEGLEQRHVGAPGSLPMDPFRRSQPSLERALQRCVSEGLLHGFLSANVDYHQDEPLRRAAIALGIPFFVLLKETPLSREHAEWQRRLIGERPVPDRGDHVFVGGPLGALYVELGSVSAERLHVTGFPRFDGYRDLDASATLDHMILFPPNRLHGHSTKTFDALLDGMLAVQARTSSEFVVKCKDNRSVREVLAALEERGGATPGPLVTTDSPPQLLLRSALVVGSSTTALLEGLLTRARVLNLVSKSDLLGIPSRPDLGYETYVSVERLSEALGSIERLEDLPIGLDSVDARRGLVAEVVTLPEGRTAAASIEEVIARVVSEAAQEQRV